jgi:hypothetical protein
MSFPSDPSKVSHTRAYVTDDPSWLTGPPYQIAEKPTCMWHPVCMGRVVSGKTLLSFGRWSGASLGESKASCRAPRAVWTGRALH